MKKPNHYIFVIDTDSYAGSFEREMCAYVTGQIGDCEVGAEFAELAEKEIPEMVEKFWSIVEKFPDENGCYMPVEIWPNLRYGNDGNGNHALLNEENAEKYPYPAFNSVAIHFNELPDAEMIITMKARSSDFGKRKKIKIEGFKMRSVIYNDWLVVDEFDV
ncbi:MAG: hypothetical protein HZB68_03940 [Candidatus Aenigmarchaeota archaeon]|nr:hypothetical protein [Candidatus Aenigmarchaeota archaeon]